MSAARHTCVGSTRNSKATWWIEFWAGGDTKTVVTIAVIDGMGGGIGAQIIERLRKADFQEITIIALGSNAAATQRMIAAGANRGATGENAVQVTVGSADFILGPIGIVLPNAMMGEITPAIAEAVFSTSARKFLLPVAQPHFEIIGMGSMNMSELIAETISALSGCMETFA